VRDRPTLCRDCGLDTFAAAEYYMVHHDLWAEYVGPRDGSGACFLCIACLEDRMDRRLTADDFLPCPLNDDPYMGPRSPRLQSRLGNRG
jgi:hypothetical protein